MKKKLFCLLLILILIISISSVSNADTSIIGSYYTTDGYIITITTDSQGNPYADIDYIWKNILSIVRTHYSCKALIDDTTGNVYMFNDTHLFVMYLKNNDFYFYEVKNKKTDAPKKLTKIPIGV